MLSNIWNNNFITPREEFFNFKENGQPILKRLNYFAMLISFLKLTSVVVLGNITVSFSKPFITYLFPLALCILVHFVILKKWFNLSFFLSFYCMPFSVIFLGTYEQMTFLVIYQIAYGVVAFFILQKRYMIISSYIFSAIAILCLGINEITSMGITRTYQLKFLLANFLTFFIPFYFTMVYLRNLIVKSHISIKNKRNQLAIQKAVLEKQNAELNEQEYLLEIKNKSLMESAQFQNKIISILSHDIRVPLISIRNILGSFRKNNTPAHEIIEYLPEIEENLSYLNTLFEDMISWSKEQKIENKNDKSHFNIRTLSQEICEAYSGSAKSKKIQIINNINPSKTILGNDRYIKVILRNLLSNAIKFTKPGGEICINMKHHENFEIIYVKDNGLGISEENLYKIRNGLEVNTRGTLNETGAGIGLYFCREFATKCGGKLEVESTMGQGSIFSFSIPAA